MRASFSLVLYLFFPHWLVHPFRASILSKVQLRLQQKFYQVTVHPDTFDEHPSLRLMTFGDPLFESILFKTLEET